MPYLKNGQTRLYYRLQGFETKPVLAFVHSLGVDHGQWDEQTAALLPDFRILRVDLRGHGGSDASPGEYTIELLGRDFLAVVDALKIERFAFCGLSIGGMIGQWLAAQFPGRLTHLVLANTSAKFPDPAPMEARRQKVLQNGMAAVEDMVMGRFFTVDFLANPTPAVASTRTVLLAIDPLGYAGCCAAVRDLDQLALLNRIRTPTLIIAGEQDLSTPWIGHGDVLTRELPAAQVLHLDTAHLSNLERPAAFTAALRNFLLPQTT